MLVGHVKIDCVSGSFIRYDDRHCPSGLQNTTPFGKCFDDVDIMLKIMARNNVIQLTVSEHVEIIT